MVGAVKPGYASRNKWCLRCLLKIGNVKAEEIWVGRTWDAVDEKDFEVAIDVFLNGADMVMEEEAPRDREGVYLGRIWARYKGCWWCRTLKAVVAILKLIRWRTGSHSQCRPARTWCIVYARFDSNESIQSLLCRANSFDGIYVFARVKWKTSWCWRL